MLEEVSGLVAQNPSNLALRFKKPGEGEWDSTFGHEGEKFTGEECGDLSWTCVVGETAWKATPFDESRWPSLLLWICSINSGWAEGPPSRSQRSCSRIMRVTMNTIPYSPGKTAVDHELEGKPTSAWMPLGWKPHIQAHEHVNGTRRIRSDTQHGILSITLGMDQQTQESKRRYTLTCESDRQVHRRALRIDGNCRAYSWYFSRVRVV